MIVFHEGLPGAGKSYEACLYHILPAIKEGREVITNIEGINHEKFAELSGVPLPIVQKLLKCISHEDEPNIELRVELQKQSLLEGTGKDSMAVIDEVQDLFPSERKKLPVEWSQYIASHRHEGQDIILMGQFFGDIHAMWRRRTQRKIVFIKQTALGRDANYTWQAFEATVGEKFKLISSGSRKYEKKYFGLYASHTGGTNNKNVYSDDRTVIWKTPAFKYGIPAVVVCSVYAVSWLVGFFTVDDVSPSTPTAHVVTQTPSATSEVKPQVSKAPPVVKEVPPEYVPIDVFDDLANRYRARLAGVIQSKDKLIVKVEILDSSYHRQDHFDGNALREMGWTLNYSPAGLQMTKGARKYLIRAWPVDSWGKVNEGTRSSLTGANAAGVPTGRSANTGPNVIVLENRGPERMEPTERRTGNRA